MERKRKEVRTKNQNKMHRYKEHITNQATRTSEKVKSTLGSTAKSLLHYPKSTHCGLRPSSDKMTPVGDQLEAACYSHDEYYGEHKGSYTTFNPADEELMGVARNTFWRHPVKSSVVYGTFATKKALSKTGIFGRSDKREEQTGFMEMDQSPFDAQGPVFMNLDDMKEVMADDMDLEEDEIQLKLRSVHHTRTKLDLPVSFLETPPTFLTPVMGRRYLMT